MYALHNIRARYVKVLVASDVPAEIALGEPRLLQLRPQRPVKNDGFAPAYHLHIFTFHRSAFFITSAENRGGANHIKKIASAINITFGIADNQTNSLLIIDDTYALSKPIQTLR
jgi:hypothetical protein